MSNTATTKERQRLTALLKEKGTDIKHSQTINVHVYQGRVVISDYTHKDDYNEVLALLGAAGIKPDVQTESWCG